MRPVLCFPNSSCRFHPLHRVGGPASSPGRRLYVVCACWRGRETTASPIFSHSRFCAARACRGVRRRRQLSQQAVRAASAPASDRSEKLSASCSLSSDSSTFQRTGKKRPPHYAFNRTRNHSAEPRQYEPVSSFSYYRSSLDFLRPIGLYGVALYVPL